MRKFCEEGKGLSGLRVVSEQIPGGRPLLGVPRVPNLCSFGATPGAIRRRRSWSRALVPPQGTASGLRHGVHLDQPPGRTVLPPRWRAGGAGRGAEGGEEGGGGRRPGCFPLASGVSLGLSETPDWC